MSRCTLSKSKTIFFNPEALSLLYKNNVFPTTTKTLAATTAIRFYFTNGDAMKRNDPYAKLGLQWGDGATSTEIKQAFRTKARELHPDVNKIDTPEQALKKFQELQKAYETLIKATTGGATTVTGMVPEEWRFAIWRTGDRIAVDRTDVAGVLKKRPAQPAESKKSNSSWGMNQLGHPDGRGAYTGRNEYISDGSSSKPRSSSVGRGTSKWVKPTYKPWNPNNDSMTVRAKKTTNNNNK